MGLSRRRTASLLVASTAVLLLMVAGAYAEDSDDLSGIYELEGTTVVGETGSIFALRGKMVVKQEGDHLETFVEADVKRTEGKTGPATLSFVSHGSTTVSGKKLAGVADIQTIVMQVPGVDVAAPYMPRQAGPIFKATTAGKVTRDGDLELWITSDTQVFGPGRDRVTKLKAHRVARKASELKPPAERKKRQRPPAPEPIDPLSE
jgi:hypothetical protein